MIETFAVVGLALLGGCAVFYVIARIIVATDPPTRTDHFRMTTDARGATVNKPVQQAGIHDRDLTWKETHLPLTEAKVRAALANPNIRYMDTEALYFSLCNHPDFGMAHPLIEEVLEKQGTLINKP